MFKEKKEIFGLRKSKVTKSLQGAVLGAVLISGALISEVAVKADEVSGSGTGTDAEVTADSPTDTVVTDVVEEVVTPVEDVATPVESQEAVGSIEGVSATEVTPAEATSETATSEVAETPQASESTATPTEAVASQPTADDKVLAGTATVEGVPATNLTEGQDPNFDNTAKTTEGVTETSLEVQYEPSNEYKQALSDAEANGVKIVENTTTEIKVANTSTELEQIRKDLDAQYEKTRKELESATKDLQALGSDLEYQEYLKKLGEYKKATKDYQDALATYKSEVERITKLNTENTSSNAEEIRKYNDTVKAYNEELKTYVETLGNGYAYQYAFALEEAIDDDRDTANIWNVEISGGVPLKTENIIPDADGKVLGDDYFLKMDSAYWVGKEAPTYTKAKLGDVEAYAVRLSPGQSVTVRYSYKDGSNLALQTKHQFENSEGIVTDVKYVEYTYTMSEAVAGNNEEIIYVVNDANVPFYRGVSDYTQLEDDIAIKSPDLKLGAVSKFDTTIRGLDVNGDPLRLHYRIVQADGSEKSLIEYLDVMNENLFVNSEKTTKVRVTSPDGSPITDEHGTVFNGQYTNIEDVPNLDPNFRDNTAWMEVWAGMLNNKGEGIRYRTFSYLPNTVKNSQNVEPTSTTVGTSGAVKVQYEPAGVLVYTSDGTLVPSTEYTISEYKSLTGAPADMQNANLDYSKFPVAEWGGYKLTFNDPNSFYYKYVQNDKDLKIIWTTLPEGGSGEVRKNEQTWDLSEYKGMLDPQQKTTTINVTTTYDGTVDFTHTDANNVVTNYKLNEAQYTEKVKEGIAPAYLTVNTTDASGRTTTKSMHYTEYFKLVKNPPSTPVTVTQMVQPYFTKPFEFKAWQTMTKTTTYSSSSTSSNSGVRVAGHTAVASISSMRGNFEWDSMLPPIPPKNPEPKDPVPLPDPPTEPNIEPPKSITRSREVTLPPNYIIKLSSSIEKVVKNSDGVVIQGKFVPKGSAVVWELTTDNLPAGRKETTSAVFSDVLPDGYELDLTKTQAENPLYDITYDQATRKLTATAKASTLAEWNKLDPTANVGTNTYSITATPIMSEATTPVLVSKDMTLVTDTMAVRSLRGQYAYVPAGSHESATPPKHHLFGVSSLLVSVNSSLIEMRKGDLASLSEDTFVNYTTLRQALGDYSIHNLELNSPNLGIDKSTGELLLLVSKNVTSTASSYQGDFKYIPLTPHLQSWAKDIRLDPTTGNLTSTSESTILAKLNVIPSNTDSMYTTYEYIPYTGNSYLDMVSSWANSVKNFINESGVDPSTVFVDVPYDFHFDNTSRLIFGDYGNLLVVGLLPVSQGDVGKVFSGSSIVDLAVSTSPKSSLHYVVGTHGGVRYRIADSGYDSALDKTHSDIISAVNPLTDLGVKVYSAGHKSNSGSLEVNIEGGVVFVSGSDYKLGVNHRTKGLLIDENEAYRNYMSQGVAPTTTKEYSAMLFEVTVPAGASISELRLDSDTGYPMTTSIVNLKSDKSNHETVFHDVTGRAVEFVDEEGNASDSGTYFVSDASGLRGVKFVNDDGSTTYRYVGFELSKQDFDDNGNPRYNNVTLTYTLDGNVPEGSQITASVKSMPSAFMEFNKDDLVEIASRTDTYVPPTSGIAEAVVTPVEIHGIVTNDKGVYNNNFVFTVNNGDPDRGGSTATSNIVNTRTNEVNPIKENLDSTGKDINNLGRILGSTNYYVLNWDLDQYKGIIATADSINRGFYYFDDFPEEAVIPQANLIEYKKADGTVITGITASVYTSLDSAPQEIKDIVAKTNLNLKGAFQVFKADNAQDFFTKYVVTGTPLKIVTPMTVRGDFTSSAMYKNNAFQVDFGNGYYTNEVQNYVVKTPTPKKSNYNSEGVNINGKTVLAGSENHYTLTWDLDEFKDYNASPEDIAKGFFMVDDYPEDVLDVLPNAVTVTEFNDTPVTGITVNLYNSLEEAPENVRKAFATTQFKPNGRIQVISATNPQEFFDKYVKTGKSLNVVTVMRVKEELAGTKTTYENTAYQLNFGTALATETVVNNTPDDPNPTKAVENTEGTDINGAPVLKGSTLVYKLGWDLSAYAGLAVTTEEIDQGFFFIDDFPEGEVTPESGWQVLDSKGAKVEGIRMATYHSVDSVPEPLKSTLKNSGTALTGSFQVFWANSTVDFYNKYVSKGEKLTVVNPMKVITTETEVFQNRAFQSEFGSIRPTNPVENKTVNPDPDKDVENVDGVNIDGTIVPIGSTNVYVLTWDLDQYAGMKATPQEIAKGFVFVDDFPEEAVDSDDSKVQFKLVDGTEVTGLVATTYDSLTAVPEDVRKLLEAGAIAPTGKFQLYVPTDAQAFYDNYVKAGKNIKIYTPMTVKTVADGTEFVNKGYQIDFGSTFATKEVKNVVEIPDPEKQDLDENGRDIDGEVVPLGTTNYYTLRWDLDQYLGIKSAGVDIAKGFYMVDDFQDDAVTTNDGAVVITVESDGTPVTGVTVKTYNALSEVPENVRNALAKAGITVNGKFQLMSADNPVDFYNKYVTTGKNLKVVTPMTLINGFFGEYINTAYQIDYGTATATETVRNTVVTSEPEKDNYNGDGVIINGLMMHPNFVNYYKLKWDLDQYNGANLSEKHIQKGFYFVDDFPEEAVTILENQVVIADEAGNVATGISHKIVNSVDELPQAVKDAMTSKNVTFKGKVQLFTADNPADFYNKYLKTGTNLYITSPMVVNQDLTEGSVYRNRGYQVELGTISATEEIENVVPDVDPNKKDLNKDGVDINNTPTTLGFTNYYTLHWDLDQFKDLKATASDNAKGFYMVDDFPEDIVTPLDSFVRIETYDGTPVTGVSVKVYNSLDEAPDNVKQAFAKSTFKPVGKVQVFSADNPQEFFNNYVVTGKNLKVITPMRVRTDLENKEYIYKNTAYQVNYGKAYTTETVVNNVPPVDPEKNNTNADGVNINGTPMVKGQVNHYKLTWDLNQYQGIKADTDLINKGFYFVDDYPEAVLDLVGTPTLVDASGKAVTGVVVNVYNSQSELPENIKSLLVAKGSTLSGKVQVFTATDPLNFYNTYVSKGINISITTPMVIKEGIADGEYVNTAIQVGFDTLYETEPVRNTVVTPDPHKQDLNKDGVDINGKPMYVGGVNYYTLAWDLDQYKGMKPSNEEIAKGFHFIDDYPEEAVTIKSEDVRILTINGNTDITSEVEVRTYNSISEVPEALRTVLVARGFSPKGSFQVLSAKDATDFYNKYVKTGTNLKIVDPMVVKDEMYGSNKSYINTAYQSEFGQLLQTETVENYVPKVDPEKEDLNLDRVDINGTPVAVGMTNLFTLTWDLNQFKGIKASQEDISKGFYFVDDYPEDAVEIITKDIRLTDVNGQPVTGVSVNTYSSISEAPKQVQDMLAKVNFVPKGAVQVFSADDPSDFYTRYVEKGISILIDNPMKVKEEATGGSYANTAVQIEFNQASVTETVGNSVPNVEPQKHDLDEDGQNINNTVRVVGSTNYYTLDWDLDQFRGMIATKADIAKGFFMVDDYPEQYVTINSNLTKVTLADGTVVSGVTVKTYNSLAEAPEGVRTAFASQNINTNGAIQVFSADNPEDFYNKYVKTGMNLKVVTPMTVKEEPKRENFTYTNTAYQVNFGNPHVTATVTNNVVYPDPEKDNYNVDGVLINGTPVARGMVNEYRLVWDMDQYKGIVATKADLASGFYFVDDYPEDVVTIDSSKVKLVDANGQDVTGVTVKTYNSVSELPQNLAQVLNKSGVVPAGAFQVFVADNAEDFYNKYVKSGVNITIIDPMKVREDLENVHVDYVNRAYQVGFKTLYETKVVENEVPPVEPHKQNLNSAGVDINKTPMYVGGVNYYTLHWDLDQYKGIKADKALIEKGFHFIDDFPEEAVTIDASKVRILTASGVDVTDKVTINQYASWAEVPAGIREAFAKQGYTPKGAVQVISSKNATEFYNEFVTTGINLKVVDPMVVKHDMEGSNESYFNTAYQVDFGSAYITETVENHVPSVDPVKEDLNAEGVDINNTVVTVGTVHYYTHTWDLDQYKGILASPEDVAKGFYFIDDYPEDVVTVITERVTLTDSKGVAVVGVSLKEYATVAEAPKAVQDAIAKSGITIKGRFQVFSADNPTDFYKRYVQTGMNIKIVDPMQVKDEVKDTGAKYTNQAFQINFGNLQATEIVRNEVPVVDPVKEDLNKDGVDINGKPMAIGLTNYYTLTWKLDQYKGIIPTADQIQKGFMYIDDYPEEAVIINHDKVVVKTPDGAIVEGLTVTVYNSVDELESDIQAQFAKGGLVPKGAFQVISADNPQDFYEKYVKTGINLTIVDPMTVRDELRGTTASYENTAYQWDMGIIHDTETVINHVPKVEPHKQNLNEARVDINGREVLANSVNWYMHTWDLDQYKGIEVDKETIAKGMFFVDDYPETVVDILDDKVRVFYEVTEERTLEGQELTDAVAKFKSEVAKLTTQAESLVKEYNTRIAEAEKAETPATITLEDGVTVRPLVEVLKENLVEVQSTLADLQVKAKLTDAEIEAMVSKVTVVTEVPVEGIQVTKYASLDEAPEVVQKALKEAGFVVNGAIQVFAPVDPQAFYENFVTKGISLKILDPMRVKPEMAEIGGRYENSAFQIDFGKAHATEIVFNNIPKFENLKEVQVDGKDVNNGEIAFGQKFTYVLNGVEIPANRSDKLWEYVFVDDYQESHDKYLGIFDVLATVDFDLTVLDADGEVVETITVKKGDNLNKYVKHSHNSETGQIEIAMTDEFLNMLGNDQPFGAKVVLSMERIAYGDVENTFHNRVNGVVVKSNTVKTQTPPPPTPNTPEVPATPPTTPVLPNTGESDSSLLTMIGAMGLLSLAMVAKGKRGKFED